MTESPNEFEKTYRDYLAQTAKLDLASKAEVLGLQIDGDKTTVPFINKLFTVTPEGITDAGGERPIHAISVVLCKYLILAPDFLPEGADWVHYRDFRDAAPFVGGFENNAPRKVAANFGGRAELLRQASAAIGGVDPELDINYRFSARFDLLPRVPLLLLFNDRDKEFDAECTILFERRAEKFLDMECLAICGWLLSDFLNQAAGSDGFSVM